MVGEAEPLERAAQPARRARRGDRLRHRRKRVEKGLDPFDRRDLLEPSPESLAGECFEVGRQRSADLRLDRGAGVGPVQADVAVDRLPGGGGVAERGQPLGEDRVGQDLAVDDDPVEIEDERCEPQRRSPNRAVPTRTWVAPIVTAVS
jgi:hypothetical protein